MASIDDQIQEMKATAERLDIDIVEIITEAKSAKAPGRGGFNKVLSLIHDGKADGILCWKLNRLARNPVDGGQISWMLQQGLIKHIQTYGREYRPSDNVIVMAVELGMANQYVKDLSVDTKRGLRSKARRGWYPISNLPTGYKHNTGYEMGSDEVVQDPERFHIIKEMWNRFLTGNYSVAEIYEMAKNELGLKNKNGRMYSKATLYNLLNSEFYAGYYYWSDQDGEKERIQGKHVPMISEADFQKGQILLGKRSKPTRIIKYDHPYRGIMSCGECGCGITMEHKLQVRCTDCKHKFSSKNRTDCPKCELDISEMKNPPIIDKVYARCTKKKGPCSQKYIEVSILEDQIREQLSGIEIPATFHLWAKNVFEAMHEEETDTQKQIISQSSKRETELVEMSKNYYRMFASNKINQEQMDEFVKEVDDELSLIRKNQEQTHTRIIDWFETAKNYLNFADNAVKKFNETDDIKIKENILRAFGSNQVLRDKKLVITLPRAYELIKQGYVAISHDSKWLEPKKTLISKGLSGESMKQIQTGLPLLDEFRTLNWNKIQQDLEFSGILSFYPNLSLQNL